MIINPDPSRLLWQIIHLPRRPLIKKINKPHRAAVQVICQPCNLQILLLPQGERSGICIIHQLSCLSVSLSPCTFPASLSTSLPSPVSKSKQKGEKQDNNIIKTSKSSGAGCKASRRCQEKQDIFKLAGDWICTCFVMEKQSQA